MLQGEQVGHVTGHLFVISMLLVQHMSQHYLESSARLRVIFNELFSIVNRTAHSSYMKLICNCSDLILPCLVSNFQVIVQLNSLLDQFQLNFFFVFAILFYGHFVS